MQQLRSKLLLAMLLMCITCSASPTSAQTVSINLTKATLTGLFNAIERQTTYRFSYKSDDIDNRHDVTVKCTRASVSSVLSEVLPSHGLAYQIVSDNTIAITKASPKRDVRRDATSVRQKAKLVTGTIRDDRGEPIVGATVYDPITKKGTVTDVNGKYTLEVGGDASLVVSYVGCQTQKVKVGGKQVVNLTMKESVVDMSELVVTALGMKRSEKALGYATQKVSGDQFDKVKGVNVATSMSGRIAGLTIFNSTEFMEAPTISLRGETPLLVLDGVPTNLTLADINSDIIESIDVLKGATASALYGSRGGSGAIMVTTKKTGKKGFTVDVNSSNMFNCGTLALPKVQHSYSSGYGGKYNVDDEVWGDKLDIGRVYSQYNPYTKKWEDQELTSKGKDNFNNFLRFSMISNNTVSITQKGENGSVRASASFIYDRGQYPNQTGKVFQYNIGGEMKLGKKADIQATMGFEKQLASNTAGTGYTGQGYIYNLLVWTGPEYDIRDYRDYWAEKDVKQNWMRKSWYDNPWFMAYEKINRQDNTKANGMITVNYHITPWLTAMVRGGFDYTNFDTTKRSPAGINSTKNWGKTNKGYFMSKSEQVFTTNDDFILMFQKTFGDLTVDALGGYSIYYYRDKYLQGESKNGLSIPGFYSLKASVESPTVEPYLANKQVNSLYAKATLGFKSTYYLDVTGRNDWSSTLPDGDNSYFYPSIGASVLMSNVIKLPKWWSFWKIRGSWTVSKRDIDIYATNQAYTINNSVWNGLNSAVYPTTMRGNVKPITDRTWEIGTAMNFINNRLRADFTYYNKHTYNNTAATTISAMSGFKNVLVNTQEEYTRRGIEFFIDATPIKGNDFQWNVVTNWARSARYYSRIDPVYTEDKPWVYKGARADAYTWKDLMYAPDGQMILVNGKAKRSKYETKIGNTEPDWTWGLTNNFRYKGFTLTIGVDGRIGGLSNARTCRNLWKTGAHPDTDNQWRYDEVVNGKKTFVAPGVKVVSGDVKYDTYGNITEDTRVFAPNDVPVSYESFIKGDWVNGAQFIFSETFIKLRELSLTYDIPSSICHSIGLTSSSVSLIGQNLLLWTKEYKFADPDKASDDLASPSVRYVGVNIKLQF